MKQLRCGFSQIDITPNRPDEVYLDGYGYRITPAQGVRDPIYAKVCVMEGDQEFAIISLDICGLNNSLKDRLCELISLMANIKRERFALCATHTHAGPACGVLANLPINMLYWNKVAYKICKAIEQARASAKEGSFRFTKAGKFTLPMNRRGREDINRNIWVCGFYDQQDVLQGVITAGSCHAVCNLSYDISADFPGVLTRKANEAYPNVPFLYLQSRGADINPPCAEEEGIEKMGSELSELVLNAVGNLKDAPKVQATVNSAFATVNAPMVYVPKEDLKLAIKAMKEQISAVIDDDNARRALEVELQWCIMAQKEVEAGNTDPTIPVDLQVLTIGREAVFAFIPFEVLTATGNAVEKELCSLGFPLEGCYVVGYANGTNSYLCPAAEARQEGYETRHASHWYMLPECCEQTEPTVIQNLVELAKSLV